ncbi:GNAT family N-acetyltransferase [Micromonospora sp. HUAS LYJ1]|uniref:GNAT family N-acetyltransferase n=1 Tax=Micromonospora sp. HUAS LYJ1 TaxID=3061626 RepID=UPI0026717613|nr:GNAT family N-acetyltransferase [Micromonospora sp. HUAS LYJ1]WKU04446.1 GNAT family N-acetyltransferase [Micromonospora sp. HUAS LYJ1]
MPTDPQPRLSTVPTIGAVPPDEWDRLAAGAQLYQSHGWLRWAEEYFAELRPRYVLAHDADGALLGGVATYLMTEVPTRYTTWYDPVRMFLAPHCDPAGAAERWFPVLLVGGCSGYHGELLVASHLDGEGQARIARALLDRCRDLAAELGAQTTTFMYATKQTAEDISRIWGGAGPVIATSAEAIIPLDGAADFEGYLARFPSARRSKLRKELTAFTGSGSRLGRYRLVDVLTEVTPLMGGHQRKFGADISDEEIGRYLRLQDKHLGSGSVVFVDERDGRINGFTLCYAHGDTLYSRAAGLAPEAGPFAYFNLAVYAPIRHAIEGGLRAVALGAGSYQGKVLRGAEVHGLWSAVVPPEPLEDGWREVLGRPFPQAVEAGCA